MIVRTALAIVCAATLGLAVVSAAQATSSSHHKKKHHVVLRTGTKKTAGSGGVHVNSGDVNGDGTSDVVVASPPKPKPKKSSQ
jgi:hypothetical protein